MEKKKFDLLFIIICLIILFFVVFYVNIPNLNSKAKIVIFTIIFTLVLWIFKTLPYSVTGLLSLVLMYFFRVDTFSNIFFGFSSAGWFFFFGVLILGYAVLKTDITGRITLFVIKISKNKKTFAFLLPFLLIFQSLIIPSATARTVLLSPIFYNAIKKSSFKNKDSFLKYTMLNLGILNPISSSAYLSGGASTIIAGEIMSNYGIPINWLLWLKYLWLPITLVVIFSSYQLFFLYNYKSKNTLPLSLEMILPKIGKKIIFQEKCIIIVTIFVIVSWIIGSYLNISNAIPAILGIIFLYFPGINLLTVDDLKKINWDLLIFIGVSISFANLIISSGAGKWLAEYIFSYAYFFSNTRFVFFLMIFLLLSLVRLIFPNLTTYNACVLPAMLSTASYLNEELLSMTTITILAGIVSFFPIQSISSLLLFEKRCYRMSDTIITGFTILISVFIVIMFFL